MPDPIVPPVFWRRATSPAPLDATAALVIAAAERISAYRKEPPMPITDQTYARGHADEDVPDPVSEVLAIQKLQLLGLSDAVESLEVRSLEDLRGMLASARRVEAWHREGIEAAQDTVSAITRVLRDALDLADPPMKSGAGR